MSILNAPGITRGQADLRYVRVDTAGQGLTSEEQANARGNVGQDRLQQYVGWSVISTHSIATTGPASGTTSRTSRIEVVPPFDVKAIVAVFDNRQTLSNTEAPFYNPIIVGASVQTSGSAIDESTADMNTPMTFSGVRNKTVTPGSQAETDPLFIPASAGVRLWLKAYVAAVGLPAPAAPSAVASAGAGLVAGTFAVGYTVVYPGGIETPGSSTTSVSPSAGNLRITITGPAAATYPGAIGWRPMLAARGATTPLYDIGAGVVPLGTNYVYSREPSVFGPLPRVLAGAAASYPVGGGVNGGTGTTGSNNGEYSLDSVDYTGSSAANPGGVRSSSYGPAVVLGLDPERVHASLGIVGDSIPTATADYGFAANYGGFAVRAALGQTTQRAYDQSVVPTMGHVLVSQGGETAAQFASMTGVMRTKLASFCTTIGCFYGTNDLSAGTSAAAIIGSVYTIASRFTCQNRNFRIGPLLPRATSSDGWKTVANQSIGNQSLEGNRRQFNSWALSTAATAVVGEVPFTAASGTATPATNFYSGGNGASTTFIARKPFVQGSQVVKVAGVTKVLTTDYTYYGAATINGVAYASGVVMLSAPASGLTLDYTPMPIISSLLGQYAATWDYSAVLEVDAAGVAATNGGWWKPDTAAPLVTGTTSGTNSATVFNDTSKSWTTNQYRGYCLRIVTDSGNPSAVGVMGCIGGNSATQLTIGGSGLSQTPSNSATYEIYDPYTLDGTHPPTRGHMLLSAAIPVGDIT